mmetsp:Transcript_3232/g.5067  ORF Transcript_3232/g.5067 Transcript_3232/m.5067 type:complete len:97 (+) Transcript_3232:179-469(+)
MCDLRVFSASIFFAKQKILWSCIWKVEAIFGTVQDRLLDATIQTACVFYILMLVTDAWTFMASIGEPCMSKSCPQAFEVGPDWHLSEDSWQSADNG